MKIKNIINLFKIKKNSKIPQVQVPTQAESILVLSGVPSPTPVHATAACQFGVDLLAMVHSFCAATGAQLQVRVGIGSGSLSAGIVGARRWHYDVLGMALDAAVHLEANCAVGCVFDLFFIF